MDPADIATHVATLTQRVETLSQTLNELRLENQGLRHYITQNLATRAQQADPPEPKINPPEIFSGDRQKYREFLNACRLLFDLKPRTYPTDRIKVCTMISYLKGEPRLWANMFLEKEDDILQSLDDFIGALSSLYDDPAKQITAETALRALKQGKRPVEDFIIEFKRLAIDSQWNNISLKNQFRLGLSDAIKDELARTELPDTLEGLIQLVITIDRRLRERRAERATSATGFNPRYTKRESEVPMEIGTIPGTLTPTERMRRRNLNLCLYCAAPDHIVKGCPLLTKKKTDESPILCNLFNQFVPSANYFYITMLLQWDQCRIQVKAMVDTGACGNFIDKDIVFKNKIPSLLKPSPISVRVIDGNNLTTGPITHQTQPLVVTCNDNHVETLTFDLISSPLFPIILGLPWLSLHQPRFDWETKQLRFESSFCQQTCFMSTVALQAATSSEEVQAPSIPSPYLDLADVFSKRGAETLPPHRIYDCPIDLLPNCNIPYGRIYPLSQPELQYLKDYLDDNLQRGFIRPSSSPAAAGMFFVRNKDNSLRPIIDYRELNKITVKNRYPLPLIPELLERLQKATIFTKLDLKGAYNLIRMRAGDEWKTAFRTRYGLFEYLVMPFGLCNAPATFQYFINDIFKDLLDVCVVIYLDDILIYSNNLEEHRKHVRWVLARLRVHKLYAKLEKCTFESKSISFLGFIISNNHVEMDPIKINSILNWASPKTVKELQRFLGFANFYRKFIRGFSAIVKPLTSLTSSKKKFKWSESAQKAFEELKERFTTAPILRLPDPNLQFILEVDASNSAIGAILSQRESPLKPLHPVAFYSRTLSPSEVNYPVGEKELLAIKSALETWRHLLEGTTLPFIIFSDHQNLQYIQKSKTLSARQIRWALYFSRFNFVITYRPGSRNGKADSLSRKDEPEEHFTSPTSIIPPEKVINTVYCLKDMLKEALSHEPPPAHLQSDSEGFLYKGTNLYVPPSLRIDILRLAHDAPLAGHPGISKTKELVRRQFWWPHMDQTIEEYVKSCDTCARAKHASGPPYGLLTSLPITEKPWAAISMDFIVELPPSSGHNTIFVVVDYLTKMAHFVPLKKLPNSQETADAFIHNIVRLHGIPQRIVSDRGTQFNSKFWKALCSKLQIDHNLSSAFHPQTNGQTERINRCLEQYLRCYCSYLQDDWYQLLPLAEFSYNNSASSTTTHSPFFANYGFHPASIPLDYLPSNNPATEDYMQRIHQVQSLLKSTIEAAQNRQKQYYDLRRRAPPDYQVGDLVWLSTKNLRLSTPCRKLSNLFIGPFPIERVLSPSAVRLSLPQEYGIHPTFHVSLLKPHVKGTFANRTSPPPPPTLVQGQVEYEVAEILDSRRRRRSLQYLIRWKGFGPQEDSWEEAQGVHAPLLVKRFHNRFPQKPGPQ